MLTNLLRNVDGKTRYYRIEIFTSLLSDFGLNRTFGSLNNKKATGSITQFFEDHEAAIEAAKKIKLQKIRKGYYEV